MAVRSAFARFIVSEDGRRSWHREPDESEEGFTLRAVSECRMQDIRRVYVELRTADGQSVQGHYTVTAREGLN